MQLAVAIFFLVQVAFSIGTSAIFVNHETMLRVLQAQGTSLPPGTDIDTVVNVSIVFAWIVTLVIAALELVTALGSYLRWRWIFWVALVLLALGSIAAVTNLNTIAHPSTSPVPTWGIAISEVISLAGLALCVWMIVGAIRSGPWATKRPGTS